MPQIGVDIGSYVFDASAKTITISGVTLTDIEQFSPIVNGNDGVDIFNPAKVGRFGTLVANVLTLQFDTTAMDDTDKLYICVNLATGDNVTGVLNASEVRINPSTEEKQDAGNTLLTTISGLDFATQTTLAAILAKIIAAPATEAKQDTTISGIADVLTELQLKADLTETQPVSAASLPLPAGASTEVTLAAVLAKIIAAPSTEAKQDTAITALGDLLTELQLKADLTETQPVSAASLPLPTGAATEITLAAILAKIIAAPATEAKQDAANLLLTSLDGKDFATQTTLAAILTAFNAEDFATETTLEAVRVLLVSLDGKDFSTETTLNGLLTAFNAEDFATQTTLAALLSAFNAEDFATQAKQDTQITNQGTQGATPPTIPGTGIIGYLRSIYDRLANMLNFNFDGNDLQVTTGATWEASANNTTTTPLGIGATFTGVVSSSEFQDIMVHVETDQVGTLFFDFTPDGTNFDTFPFQGFAHVAGVPSFHIAVKGGQQFRVRFENTSGSAQTYLRLYTWFGDFKKPNTPVGVEINDNTDAIVTHSVLTGKTDAGGYENVNATPSGNLKVTPHDSQTNSRQIIDLNGAAKFGEAIILVGDKFGGFAPNALQWDFTDLVGSGASVTLDGTQRIETGTTANSEMRFQSVKRARFMISQFNIFHGGIEIDNISDTQCERRFGAFDPINANQNGAYFALIDGAWNVAYCKDGVETLIPQANWNGTNKDLFNTNPALSVYEIQYNAGSIFFFQGPNFIHRVSGLASPYAALYDFHVACEVKNTDGNTTNNGINFRALGTYRLGEERGELISRVFTTDTLIKTGAGYCEHASLSRTGSAGGSGTLTVYDGVDATGIVMARIDVGGDDLKGIGVKSTFSFGLYVTLSGSGTNSATIGYE